MKKIAAPAVVAMFCALALASPAAGQLPAISAGEVPSLSAQPPTSKVPGVTLAPASTAYDDGGGSAASTEPGSVLAPAVDPDIRATGPSPADGALTAQLVAPKAAEPAEPAPAKPAAAPVPATAKPPQPASIPPLSASDAELANPPRNTAQTQAAPGSSGQGTLAPEALVPDSSTTQIKTVFNAINSYRASFGLAAVKYHSTVAGMAQEWSNSIASREVIQHRANFWSDPRALSPNNGAGEVIAVRWDRDAAQLVEWWKGSPAHNAILKDPRFNVVGIGVTFTDGNWQTTPNRYTMWGVVNFFGYTTLPAGTTNAPGGGAVIPLPPASVCDPAVKHMPPTLDLGTAAIKSAADLVSVNASGQLLNRPSLGNRTFGASRAIGSGFSSAKEVFITDWERDGVFDVLTQWTDGRLTLHSGIVGGGFRSPVTLGQSGWASMILAVGGWCSNNRLPQLLALDQANSLWLYPNIGKGDLTRRTLIASGVAATRLAMVDYDADGFQDLLARRSDGNVLLYRGAGVPAPRAETRTTVATGWQDVTAIRPLRHATGLNSTGVAVRRAKDIVQYWDLTTGKLASPSNITGSWSGQRLAQ